MKAKLHAAMKEAMKARDQIRLDTIRQVLAAIQYEEMQKKVEAIADDAVIAIVRSELKKRNESMEFAIQGNREDVKTQLEKEIVVLEGFLPQQLSAAQIEKAIVDLKAATPGLNLGTLMKALKEKFSGQYDSKLASELGKKLLS